MSLIKFVIKVIKLKSRELITLIINTLIILLFYYLFFENSEVLYPLILSTFVIIIYLIVEMIKYKGFLQKLRDSSRSPNYSGMSDNSHEEEIFNTINIIHKDYLDKIYSLNNTINHRDTLFSQWIHNMKTSITVIDLACEENQLKLGNNKYIQDIKEENNNLKKNLEECLNVLRLDDFSRDYITNPCNLSELINTVVNSKKRDFIYKGVFPKVNIDSNFFVYTDKKWCTYMVEQLLSNAIKYSKPKPNENNVIEISAINANSNIKLLIKDYGIGIAKEDIPRIFDPFFTGSNGRKDRSSTGIGLYMVKIISKKLGHPLDIQSQLGEGTEVNIIFNNEDFFS